MTQPTQRQAWQDLQEGLSKRQEGVFRAICGSPKGMTLFELEDDLKMPVNCVSGRVTELRQAGRIVDSGARRANPRSGKSGIVWIAAKFDSRGQRLFA